MKTFDNVVTVPQIEFVKAGWEVSAKTRAGVGLCLTSGGLYVEVGDRVLELTVDELVDLCVDGGVGADEPVADVVYDYDGRLVAVSQRFADAVAVERVSLVEATRRRILAALGDKVRYVASAAPEV